VEGEDHYGKQSRTSLQVEGTQPQQPLQGRKENSAVFLRGRVPEGFRNIAFEISEKKPYSHSSARMGEKKDIVFPYVQTPGEKAGRMMKQG